MTHLGDWPSARKWYRDPRRLLHAAIGLGAALAILALFHWLTGEPLFAIAGTRAVGGPIADWVMA